MKTINQLKSLKIGAIIIASFLGMTFMSSCEKNEDFPITYSESSDVKTESMVIYKDDWCCKHNYSEVCLPAKGYIKGVTYDFIKVSIQIVTASNCVVIIHRQNFLSSLDHLF